MSILDEAISRHPVMPVLVIPDIKYAKPLAEALFVGGLTVFEVTLRTSCAPDAIARMKRAYPQAIVGAGTVINATDARVAKEAGADFVVSPGSSKALWQTCEILNMPLLPGFQSVSEAMFLMSLGANIGKFFPAESAGGIGFVKSIQGPLPEWRICPTGGVSEKNSRDYLALPNVPCVGGSWIAPISDIKLGLFSVILERAKIVSKFLD